VQGLCLKELHLCPIIIFNAKIMHFPRESSKLSKMQNVIIKSAITLKSGLAGLALFWTQVIVVESAQLADFVTSTFCMVPLAFSSAPMASLAFNAKERAVDDGLCQVWSVDPMLTQGMLTRAKSTTAATRTISSTKSLHYAQL
jgi:hypothetical protein